MQKVDQRRGWRYLLAMDLVWNTEIGIAKTGCDAKMRSRSPLVLDVVLLLEGAIVVRRNRPGWSRHKGAALNQIVCI